MRHAAATALATGVLLALAPHLGAQGTAPASPTGLPIIDMHMHAMGAGDQGPPPLSVCAPGVGFPVPQSGRRWPESFMASLTSPECESFVTSPMTDGELRERNLEVMERHHVIGVVGGPELAEWLADAPDRVIPSLAFELGPDSPPVDSLRAWFEAGRYAVLGEITNQYVGVEPSDAGFEPYLALAEELDIPIGYHMGPGPPGVPYLGPTEYRARTSSALLMEDVLLRHPELRLYVMHAGWPLLDDMLALLWAHPHIHVDVGVISWAIPRAAFHSYLERIVEAGFGKRVLFGSDQMVWPETLEVAIESIETAGFLTEAQKRDILYNNAARFLRLSEEEIARHHGREAEGPAGG